MLAPAALMRPPPCRPPAAPSRRAVRPRRAAGRSRVPLGPRTSARCALTSSVSTNSTSPRRTAPSGAVPVRLAELVGDHRREAVALPEQVCADLRRVADQDRHGDRLADRAAETEHRAADDPRAAVGEHRDTDHLPARRAEPERRLLVVGRDGAHDLAADRADDRQDHDREHQPGDEVVGDRDDAAADERDERERSATHCSAPAAASGARKKIPHSP